MHATKRDCLPLRAERRQDCVSRPVSALCLLLILGLASPASADLDLLHFIDPLAVHAASKNMRAAVKDLNTTLDTLPQNVQDSVGVDVKLLGQQVTQSLDQIQTQTVPILNDAILTDLNHMTDVVRALETQLNTLVGQSITELDSDLTKRLSQLQSMLQTTLSHVNTMMNAWIAKTTQSVLQVEDTAGVVLAQSMNRLVYDGIRYTSITLFLIGLLGIGLRLLGPAAPAGPGAQPPHRWLATLISAGCLSVFLGVSLLLSIRPDILAVLSAETQFLYPRESACQRYHTYQKHHTDAKRVASAALISSTQERLETARAACFSTPPEDE